MNIQDFDYDLPEERIAQHPLENRSDSRLMVLNRKEQSITHRRFYDITDYLEPGDCLVLNDTRVIPARLYGEKEGTGGAIEFLLLHRKTTDEWEVALKPGKKAKIGARFVFGEGKLIAEVTDILEGGNRLVRFFYDGLFENILDELGEMPLPHYIKEKLEDKERYQTVYNKNAGSAAAPTAGLHFTEALLDAIREKGVKIVFVTLHVGLGTFRPVKTEKIEEHQMHSEFYILSEEAAETINRTKAAGGRVIAVGTTSNRILETVADDKGHLEAKTGYTDIFIYPGYRFKIVDALITNFHLPKSTLIMLVSAFAGRDYIMKAYEEAVREEYRFFSFGDSMIIL